jgi:hypothetical protein
VQSCEGPSVGPRRDVWADVVGGLIDARSDPATARFDAELATAEASGAVSAEAAHRLRFWQRASVRALADHARTVLPIALGALDAARRDAVEHADQGDAALAEPRPAPDEPVQQLTPATDDTTEGAANDWSAPATVTLDLRLEGDRPARTRVPTPSDEAPRVVAPRRASSLEASGPSTLGERRPRMLVAGLTTAPGRADRST